ncbi:MAG: hypothetical protein FWG98_09090 [Candidatus Cloacimonetes bacterium]|nr:hypothetical protein [Candidatus Cloacimonadota bacterium]
MKKIFFYFGYFFMFILLVSCSGDDKLPNGDKIPSKPFLIPNLGAIGDNDWLTDINNGIDSISEGDRIRLQWERLLDNDLRTIRIYRFAGELNQSPVLIDSTLWSNNQYIDQLTSISIGDISRLDTNWYYFIRVVNLSNNFIDSDIVNFNLIQKPFLLFPLDDVVFESCSDIFFRWRNIGDTTRLRLLLICENTRKLLWHYDEYIFINDTEYVKKYDGEALSEGSYLWRVDSRGNPDHDGNYFSGSKSETRRFVIVQ